MNNNLTNQQIKELFFEIVLKEKTYTEDVDYEGKNYATIAGDIFDEEFNEYLDSIGFFEPSPSVEAWREYQINCQRCVPTYEMRRRGYDVEALGNSRGSVKLGNDQKILELWGASDKDFIKNYVEFSSRKELKYSDGSKDNLNRIIENIEPNSRYQIAWHWKGKNSGHTSVLEKTSKGVFIVDPQTGKIYKAKEYLGRDLFTKVRLLRIDNRKINEDMLKLIMKGRR
jgi:hypothetical protein